MMTDLLTDDDRPFVIADGSFVVADKSFVVAGNWPCKRTDSYVWLFVLISQLPTHSARFCEL